MTSKRLLTEEEIIQKVTDLNFQYVDNSFDKKEYKINVICENNHLTTVRYHAFLENKNKCSLCPKPIVKQQRVTMDFLINEFIKRGCTLLSTTYDGYDEPLNYICPLKHNTSMSYHIWKTNKYGCRECGKIGCAKSQNLSYDFVKQQFVNRGWQLLSTNYIAKKDMLNFICNNGHTSSMTFDGFYYANHGCHECSGSKRHTIEYVSNILKNDGFSLISTSYKNNKEKLEMKCPKGHFIKLRFDSYVDGDRCGLCSQSKSEVAIRKHLQKLGLEFIPEMKFEQCKNKTHLPFDFYVNGQFIIEFDGEQHFKSVEFFGGNVAFKKRQLHDKIKTDFCFDYHIPLLRISYDCIKDIPNCIDKFVAYITKSRDRTAITFSNPLLYDHLEYN